MGYVVRNTFTDVDGKLYRQKSAYVVTDEKRALSLVKSGYLTKDVTKMGKGFDGKMKSTGKMDGGASVVDGGMEGGVIITDKDSYDPSVPERLTGESAVVWTEESLQALTKAELTQLAVDNGVDVPDRANKEVLYSLVAEVLLV